jgi:hypothetical protein
MVFRHPTLTKSKLGSPLLQVDKARVEYGFLFGGSGFAIDPTNNHFAGPVDCRRRKFSTMLRSMKEAVLRSIQS